MNEKSKWHLVLVLYGLVALLWIGRCVSTLRYGHIEFTPSLCAVAWIAIFFIQCRRYRNREKEDEE